MDTEGNASDLAEYVRARMEALGWSLRRTAEEARISTGALSKMLNKRAEPTPETLTKLAKALQVDPVRLYRLAGIPMPTPRNQRNSRVEYLAQRIDALLKHLRPHFQNALIESVGGIVDAWEDMVFRMPELYIEEKPAPATPAAGAGEPVSRRDEEFLEKVRRLREANPDEWRRYFGDEPPPSIPPRAVGE